MADGTVDAADFDRLAYLEELVASLRPVILADHMPALVGQYRAALTEIEQIHSSREKPEGTPLDELAKRRSGKRAPAGGAEGRRSQRGG